MTTAHDFTFTALDGSPLPLKAYAGKAILVVNTASECGYTPQYAGLQKLWQARKDRGLVVLGVPSNDFGGQEPDDEAAIGRFCSTRYKVDFPMTAKQTVIGGKAHPFYRWIAEELGEAGTPRWNFHKYLIGPDGALAGAWPSSVAPESKELAAAIEQALAG
ncbi:MAG: glutathione peroxidase [Alphaproteobacteria bacterium]|nr:glutathione peroxidase [Alphaproteobacteria bacterium]